MICLLYVGGTALLYYTNHSPPLEFAHRSGFHDLHAIPDCAFFLFVMDVEDAFTFDLFFIEGMRDFIEKSDLDRFLTRDAYHLAL